MTHLVVGAGEVGTAIHAVLSRAVDTAIRDVEPVDLHADVLHVCFGWSADFEAHVKDHADHHGAQLVVVHSTVPVGTCDRHGWVHSPVRGRHPKLVESLNAFVKHFGGHRALTAAAAFERAGIRTEVHHRAAELEAGKIWELVQFGLQVQACQAIHDWCTDNDLDPDIVYTRMAETYNDGYGQLGHREFLRPILEHMPGPIGGHCVRPGAALLDHPLARQVAE